MFPNFAFRKKKSYRTGLRFSFWRTARLYQPQLVTSQRAPQMQVPATAYTNKPSVLAMGGGRNEQSVHSFAAAMHGAQPSALQALAFVSCPAVFPSKPVRSARPRFTTTTHRFGRFHSVPQWRCAIRRPERYDAADWTRSLKSLPQSLVLRRIRGRILANVLVATACVLVHLALSVMAPGFMQSFKFTALPHTYISSATGLLLVFRTNAAYVSSFAHCSPAGSRIHLRLLTFSFGYTHRTGFGKVANYGVGL